MEERKEEKRRNCRMEEWRDGAGRHVSAPPSHLSLFLCSAGVQRGRVQQPTQQPGRFPRMLCASLRHAGRRPAHRPHAAGGRYVPAPDPAPVSTLHHTFIPHRLDDNEAHVHPRQTSERPETDCMKLQHVIKRETFIN